MNEPGSIEELGQIMSEIQKNGLVYDKERRPEPMSERQYGVQFRNLIKDLAPDGNLKAHDLRIAPTDDGGHLINWLMSPVWEPNYTLYSLKVFFDNTVYLSKDTKLTDREMGLLGRARNELGVLTYTPEEGNVAVDSKLKSYQPYPDDVIKHPGLVHVDRDVNKLNLDRSLQPFDNTDIPNVEKLISYLQERLFTKWAKDNGVRREDDDSSSFDPAGFFYQYDENGNKADVAILVNNAVNYFIRACNQYPESLGGFYLKVGKDKRKKSNPGLPDDNTNDILTSLKKEGLANKTIELQARIGKRRIGLRKGYYLRSDADTTPGNYFQGDWYLHRGRNPQDYD